MNVKTRIKDDKVLIKGLENKRSLGKMLKTFDTLKIKTVQDLMNTDPCVFTDISRDKYTAIAYIFRNKYLGEEFQYDYILDKVYPFSDGLYDLACDLHTLGVVRKAKDSLAYLCFCTTNYSKQEISMEFVLNNYYYSRNDLAKYYINYMNERKNGAVSLSVDRKIDPNILESYRLQAEIETLYQVFDSLNFAIDCNPSPALINFRNTIDIQIKDKQNQYSALEGTEYTRKRK